MPAGPGRAAQLLGETLELPPLSYVAATPGGWALLRGDPVLRLDTASLLGLEKMIDVVMAVPDTSRHTASSVGVDEACEV